MKPGDQVLFGKYAGTEIKLEGEELLVMREADIMAVLEDQVGTMPRCLLCITN